MSGPANYGQLGLAFQRHSDTSRAAAESMADARPSALRRVYVCILMAGAAGLTDEAIGEHLEMSGNTVRPRRVELVTGGYVAAGGESETRSGRMATRWHATGKAL